MLSNGSPEDPSSSTSYTPPSAAIEQSIELPPRIEVTVVGGDEAAGMPGTASQAFETTKVPVPQPLVNQPSFTASPPPGSNPGISVPLQMFEPPQFVSPQEIFSPPQSVEFAKDHPDVLPLTAVDPPAVAPPIVGPSQAFVPNKFVVSPMIHEPSLAIPSPVLEKPQTVPPVQALLAPIVHEPHSLVISPPILESPQVVTAHHVVSPVVTTSLSLVSPNLGSSQPSPSAHPVVSPMVAAHSSPVTSSPNLGSSQPSLPTHAVVSPMATINPSLITSSSLESCQAVITNHVVPPMVTGLSLAPPYVGGSPQTVTPQRVDASQKLVSQHRTINPSPQVIHKPQVAAVRHSSDLVEGTTSGNSEATVMLKSPYKLRDVTASTRPRRESIEGAPDIILSLGGSGYELATPSSQRLPTTSVEDDTGTSVSPPSSLDELVVPSSQQSLEGCLTIPMEAETSAPASPSADEPIVPSSQQSLEEPPTIPATSVATTKSNTFAFALRVIPNFSIDQSDFPSWLLERGRLDRVLTVEGGKIWEKLITTWLRQERRLGFGLNERIVSQNICRTSSVF